MSTLTPGVPTKEEILDKAAEEYVTNFPYNTAIKVFKAGAQWASTQPTSEALKGEEGFAEWASHSDWTYLPSKKLWYNEEDEENITPKSTEQLYSLYIKSKQ